METFIRNFIAKQVRLIKKSRPDNLLKLLSAIEYVEGILEITASKLFGEKFKWFIIFITHLVKCFVRLQLLIIHKLGIQTLPSLFTLKTFIQNKSDEKNKTVETIDKDASYRLKHSGRVIRSIKNSPASVEDRDWVIPNPTPAASSSNVTGNTDNKNENDVDFDPTQDKFRYIAEVLHIMRPVCHLSCIFLFRSKSWIQFGVPLTMDTLSFLMMNGTENLSKSQKKEMRRRAILFLHYFIRSPVYDTFSCSIINFVLSQFEQRIPGMKYLIKPLNEYIPYWRSIYNYCWTS